MQNFTLIKFIIDTKVAWGKTTHKNRV